LSPTTQLNVAYTDGIYGQAVSFTNLTSGNPTSNIYYATIPSFSSTSGFTFSFWFKFTSGSFYTTVPVSIGGYFFYFINGSDSKIYPNANGIAGGPATPAISLNTWYNIAGVFTSSLVTTYLNGVQSNTHTVSNFSTVNAFVGSSGASYGFIGNVQDLRIYNTALSAPQIFGIYQSQGIPPRLTLTGRSPSPTYAWPFQNSVNDSIQNLAPTYANINGTYTTSSVTWPYFDTSSQKYGTSSIQFSPLAASSAYTGNCLAYSIQSIPISGGGQISFSLWIKFYTIFPAAVPFFIGGTSGQWLYIYCNGSSGIGVNTSFNFSSNNPQPISGTITTGNWYHVAITANGSVIAAYTNGTSQTINSSSTYPYVNVGSNVLNLVSFSGAIFNTPSSANVNGNQGGGFEVADVRIYNTALSAQQIQGIYTSGGILPRVALTTSTGGLPNPNYAWNFDGTAIDSISGIVPTFANVNGVDTTGVYSTWANQLIYDSTAAKYGSAISLRNPNGPTITSNALYFRSTSGFKIPFGDVASSTVTFWVKFLDTRVAGSDNTILFLSRASGQVTYYIYNGGTTIGTYGSWRGASAGGPNVTLTPVNGTWYHITLVITNTMSTMYLNGSAGTPVTYTAVAGGSSNVWDSLALASYDFGGASARAATSSIEIDDLRFYTTALSNTQIQTIFQSGGNLYGANLVQPTYNWPFNGSTIDVIQGKDFATSNVSGTLNVKPYPFYDTTGQKAGNGSIAFYNPSGNASNALIYNVSFPIDQSNACTYSFWFKWIAVNSGSFFKVYSTGASTNGMGSFQINNNNLNISFNSISGSGITLSGTFSNFNISSLGVWYHVAVVATSSEQKVYGNGNLLGTYTYSPPLNIQSGSNTIAVIQLSCPNGLASNPTNSTSNEIADLRFYNQALTIGQIQGIYLSGGARPSAVLTSG
jgi:hypothetical protein